MLQLLSSFGMAVSIRPQQIARRHSTPRKARRVYENELS
jgi:hypothetical protein